MKKLVYLLLTIIIMYSIYFDMTVGTLPHANSQKPAAAVAVVHSDVNIPYFKANVKPGDTLLSIVEHQIKKPLPVPMNDLIHDFQSLNPGQSADKIQIGTTYRFPDYTK